MAKIKFNYSQLTNDELGIMVGIYHFYPDTHSFHFNGNKGPIIASERFLKAYKSLVSHGLITEMLDEEMGCIKTTASHGHLTAIREQISGVPFGRWLDKHATWTMFEPNPNYVKPKKQKVKRQ